VISLSVVLYGYETWSLALRGQHGLRVFENRVLSRILGQERDEVTGDWRKLSNYNYNDEVTEVEMDRECSTDWERGLHIGFWRESQKENTNRKTKT
jgi:hypothetical protein